MFDNYFFKLDKQNKEKLVQFSTN